mmetsp:Transcript_22902/g.58288  ORF Transcript_22902/g.58288 Transcript_22902/m.58288 type:complete len:212 (+) Transcript_22902:160-795(+)
MLIESSVRNQPAFRRGSASRSASACTSCTPSRSKTRVRCSKAVCWSSSRSSSPVGEAPTRSWMARSTVWSCFSRRRVASTACVSAVFRESHLRLWSAPAARSRRVHANLPSPGALSTSAGITRPELNAPVGAAAARPCASVHSVVLLPASMKELCGMCAAASISGVKPPIEGRFRSAPLLISMSTHVAWPRSHAIANAVSWLFFSFRQLTS